MKAMKVETCPTCRWKTIRRATCWDCRGTDMRDGVMPIGCWTGRDGTRLCKEFRPRPGVKIVKEKQQ